MYRLLLFFFFPACLTAQGIQFEHDDWKTTLAKAKSEGKIIFLDAYTTWCGPCKAMTKNVFTDEAVGTWYNANFLNVKMDMERGDGLAISDQYKIWAYPSLLFIDGAGNVLHRATGYHAAEDFIALGKTALDPDKNLAALDRKYAGGERSNAFLLAYIEVKAAAYDPETGSIAALFLAAQPSLETPENMDVLMRYIDDPTGNAFAFFLKKRDAFEARYGKAEAKAKVESVFYNYFEAHPELQLADIQQFYQRIYPEQATQLGSAYRLYWYSQHEDAENYMQAALDHFARYPSDNAEELHEAAWVFCEHAVGQEALKTALSWAQRAVELDETTYNQFTLARLYAKNAAVEPARKSAQRSIELGKLAGEDTEMVEAFLAGLK